MALIKTVVEILNGGSGVPYTELSTTYVMGIPVYFRKTVKLSSFEHKSLLLDCEEFKSIQGLLPTATSFIRNLASEGTVTRLTEKYLARKKERESEPK